MIASKSKELALASLRIYLQARVDDYSGLHQKGLYTIMDGASTDFRYSCKHKDYMQLVILRYVKAWATTYWTVPTSSSRYRKWVAYLNYRPKGE